MTAGPRPRRLRRTRRAVRFVGRALVGLVVSASFALLAFLGLGPRTGRYRTLTVLSGSMTPGIPVGAVVVDTPEPGRDLRVGQIVTYAIPVDDRHVISHRVVRIVEAGDHPIFVTKGDANATEDPWVAQAEGTTMWRVRLVIPQLGTAIHQLRQPAIHRLGVYGLPAVLAVWWIVGIWRDGDEAPEGLPAAGGSAGGPTGMPAVHLADVAAGGAGGAAAGPAGGAAAGGAGGAVTRPERAVA